MLDISLANAVVSALPPGCQLLFIGDADQLPSVGAGNVLKDMIGSERIPCFQLTQVFRQAKESLIISHAHSLNRGEMLNIVSPFRKPESWHQGIDCMFIDSDEATQDQLKFINRVKRLMPEPTESEEQLYQFRCDEAIKSAYEPEFEIPKRYQHVDIERVLKSETEIESFKSVMKKIHPWSSLHYGLTAVDVVLKLYIQWIPKYLGKDIEIQVLSPMTRGSLGTAN